MRRHPAPDLLETLLTTPPAMARRRPAQLPAPRYDARYVAKYLGIGMGIGLLLFLLFMVGDLAYAAYRIQSGIAEMRPETPAVVGSPVPREPTFAMPINLQATVVSAATARSLAPSPTAAGALGSASATPELVAAAATALEQPAAESPTPPLIPLASPTITPVSLGGDPAATPALAALPTLAPGALGQRAPPMGDATTVLLLGVDRRPNEAGPARADSIMVVRIEPDRQRIALLSLPRDLIVNIPGYGYARINASSVYGELYPELGGGTESARRTVSQLLDIPIDYVMTIDFMGFIAAVDAIGGIDVNVEKEIYDPSYPTMDYRYEIVHFLPGPQRMDGATALKYGRTRHADSDWDRADRQQQIIVGIANQLRARNAFGAVHAVADLTQTMSQYIVTDLPQSRIIGLAWAFRDLDPNRVERYVLDGSMVSMGAPGDPYAQFALPGALEGLVSQLMRGGTP